MIKSHEEILRLLERMSISADGFVYKGATRFLDDRKKPVKCAAVDDLIERSKEYSVENRLYVLAIGAITNIASWNMSVRATQGQRRSGMLRRSAGW